MAHVPQREIYQKKRNPKNISSVFFDTTYVRRVSNRIFVFKKGENKYDKCYLAGWDHSSLESKLGT